MLKLKVLPQAVKDLESIYEFTLISWGFSQAEKYQDELYNYMITISKNPQIGSIYYFKKGNYRKLNGNRHIIFYRETNNEIIIVRFLHEKIDLNLNL
jgi:toxin ParE1/3/4